ncbi:hypothetical protein ISF_07072 [Cordyceps fumosorosea ARSEF 2679]|uniref:Uncharacterized protein n=1 Tax=Cordyceps fumosorosea (strain ARSEF 2679) TaxID=1081104 RepID=A0A167PYQ3_CORFA|nr:hypothetical protein ISF_07072 [Cordyceps fumosorosea ARSEF 2679]OAA57151.1 hypothetical protein ISF_07072 [Cordyceps fumosorosea ARSEF 2679]
MDTLRSSFRFKVSSTTTTISVTNHPATMEDALLTRPRALSSVISDIGKLEWTTPIREILPEFQHWDDKVQKNANIAAHVRATLWKRKPIRSRVAPYRAASSLGPRKQ